MAQDFSVEMRIKEIDSLIQYYQLDIAREKTDNLYQQLTTSKNRRKYREEILEARFRQAVILDRKDGIATEPLGILLEIIDQAEALKLHSLVCRTYLMIALAYEKAANEKGDFKLTNEYLNKAYKTYKDNRLEAVYSTYCVRRSSYYRLVNNLDSSMYYAKRAQESAIKYDNETDLMDSFLLFRIISRKTGNYSELLRYNDVLLEYSKKTNNPVNTAVGLNSIASTKLKMQDLPMALAYSDSAYAYYDQMPYLYKDFLPKTRYEIFEAMGNIDSAYYYVKQYYENSQLIWEEEEAMHSEQIERQYQSNKKEATIRSKNQQMIFIGCLLIVIGIGSIILIRKNRQIEKQNKIIRKQIERLSETIEQKQMILSELQHRVKNNLQHVISILDMQKESVDFNNIDEVIRGNQNRIHSMALLHKKLKVSDSVNYVDLKKYVVELAELVKKSYDRHKKEIKLNVNCEIEVISMEKVLPLGLIIVELVSNSMKHAFKNRNVGIINLEITRDKGKNRLYYSDNGMGYNFDKSSEKGLGLEIIKGLIDQLNGVVEASNKNGFELIMYFE